MCNALFIVCKQSKNTSIMSNYEQHPERKEIDAHLSEFFNKYVEMSGKSSTVGGEIVRAINRCIYRWYNDGDIVGEGYGKETCNPAFRYLLAKLEPYKVSLPVSNNLYSGFNECGTEYDYKLYESTKTVLQVLDEHPELFETKNTEDMWDYKTVDDYDDDWDDDDDDDDMWYDDEDEEDDDEGHYNF